MEENNENEKSLLKKGADKVKQVGENVAKKGIAHIIKPLLPAIITAIVTFLACLLVIGFMLAVQKVIQDVFDAILGIFDSSQTATAITTEYSSNFLEAAQQVHDEEMGWEYFYGEAEGRTYEQGLALLRSPASAALDNKNKVTCCATYVSCVLYASGHFTEEEIGYDMHSPLSIDNLLKANLGNGWEKITNKDALRPGDIVLLDKDNDLSSIDHVQIYAGDNKWYNAGNTYDIQHTAPKQSDDNWDTKNGFTTWWAYRPPVEPKNPPAKRTPDSYNGQIISIDENGAYKLNSEDLSKKILEELERQKVNNKVTEFDLTEINLDEFGDMINKYIEAEVKTTYPKTEHPGSDIDGMIVIKRASADLKETIPLEYKKYDEFCGLVNRGSDEAFRSFSLNPETFELCIATQGAVTKYYDFDDNVLKTEGTGGIEVREINYQKLIQNNITPVNFFIILHLISQDAEFMNELVELALGEEKTNPLELTYVDNLSTFTETHDFEGNISYSYGNITEEQKKQLPESVQKPKRTIYNKDVEPYYDIEYHKKVNTVYGGKIYVTNADTWLTSASKNVSQVPTVTPHVQPGTPTVVKSDPVSPKVYPVSDEETEETVDVKVSGYIEIKETITNKSEYTKYTVTTRQGKINVDNFVDNLISKYPKVKENILSALDLLFNMLQKSEKTQAMEKVMRYVLYKLTDLAYGVSEDDLNYLSDAFLSVSKGYKETIETKIWFSILEAGYNEYAVAGIMGNLSQYGFKSNDLENKFETGGQYSIDYTDETYTEAINNKEYTREQFISDQAGYGLAQWKTDTRKGALYDYAQEQEVGIDNENMQIEYLIMELKKYQDDSWANAESVEEATKNFYKAFVSPEETDTTWIEEKAKEYYEEYNGKTRQSLAGASYPEGTKLVYNGRYFFPVFDQWAGQYAVPYGGPRANGSKGTKTLTSSGCGTFASACVVSGLLGDASIDPISYLARLDDHYPYGNYYSYDNGSNAGVYDDAFLEKYFGLNSKVGTMNDLLNCAKELDGQCAGIGYVPGHYVSVIPAMDKSGYEFYVVDSAWGLTGGYVSTSDFRKATGYNLAVTAIVY